MTENTDMTNTEPQDERMAGRIVHETEKHDIVSQVDTAIRSLDTAFVRITVEPVSSAQWRADQELAVTIAETNECLNCGNSLEEGGFCGITCLQEWGGQDDTK